MPKKKAAPLSKVDSSGMYTVAYGAPARACAMRLLTSWQTYMPGVPVMIATDEPDAFAPFDVIAVTLDRPDIGAREPKLRMSSVTPPQWDAVLYLDADTELMEPVGFLFEAVRAGWDMVICKNPARFHTTRAMARPNNQDEVARTWETMGGDDLLQWNGGVIGFGRSEAVARVFDLWQDGWREQRNQDQPALHRALWRQPLRVLTLGNEWNKSTRYPDGAAREIIRHHQTEAREIGLTKLPPGVAGDSPEAWARVRK